MISDFVLLCLCVCLCICISHDFPFLACFLKRENGLELHGKEVGKIRKEMKECDQNTLYEKNIFIEEERKKEGRKKKKQEREKERKKSKHKKGNSYLH